jgi:hypothetical protein
MVELYNTTNRVRVIPKYRYNGKYTLAPHQSVDIEDFAADFFKPWSKVGIVVRAKVGITPTEGEGKVDESGDSVEVPADPVDLSVDGLTEEPASVEEPVDEKEEVGESKEQEVPVESVDSAEQAAEPVEADAETEAPVEDEASVVETARYTEEELMEKPIKDLKELATSLNIEIKDARKKEPIVKSILEKVNA